MSVKVEKLDEKNMIRLVIEVPADELENALERAYQRQKKDFTVPGFRKGKVPRNLIEQMYGPGIFYEEAANNLIPEAYGKAAEESGEDIVSRPTVDIVQIEKGKPFIFHAEVAVRPEVTLGEYKGIEVTEIDILPTEEEVTEEIDRERKNNSRIISAEDHPLETGDTAVIDYEGFVDGEPFQGGQGENHSLEIGSGSFIPGFEDQLIGKKAGEEVEVHVTFPDNYAAKDLEGKDAVFQVKINEVKVTEIPELDDEFAQDVSEFDTVEEYKDSVRARVKERRAQSARQTQQEEALAKIVAASEMDIPEPMIDSRCDNMIDQFSQELSGQGLTLDMYLEYAGTTLDGMKEQLRPDAERQVKSELVLDAIAVAEAVEVTDEELEEELEKMAAMYQMEVEQLRNYVGDEGIENLRLDLASGKALELVGDTMKPVLKPEPEEESEPDEEDMPEEASEPDEEDMPEDASEPVEEDAPEPENNSEE